MPANFHHADRPRSGHTRVVGIVARISGGQNQKEASLDDQIDHAKEVIAELYPGQEVEYRVVATVGKGERLDRPELAEIEAMLRTRVLDDLVAEDLGRWVRGAEAVRLCGIAVDHGTRVLAPNDCIDTADDTWEEDAISACRDHVGHNAHTSKRLKQKLMNRFRKLGGATAREPYGYVKPEGAKTYGEWEKLPGAEEIYREWAERLRQSPNCSAVADWLNARGIPPGKYCRNPTWDGAMVRRLTANTLLMGRPGRGFKATVKHHEPGRRISVKNPKGPCFLDYPHLAYWDAGTFAEINALLDEANRGRGRKLVDGADPRHRVPTKRTRFPGQHACCWYCGRECVWGGNGVTANLMCNGARGWRCWNSIGFNGAAAAGGVAGAITDALCRLEGFDAQFRELIGRAYREGGEGLARRLDELRRDEAANARQKANLVDAVAEFGAGELFREKLAAIEATGARLARERRSLEGLSTRTTALPATAADLRALFEAKFRCLAIGSPEFGNLVRIVVPEFHVYNVRLLDGGHLLPRAKVALSLAGVIPEAAHVAGLDDLLTTEATLELFEPPQRERIRVAAVALAAQGIQQREIARRLGVTQPAVGNALSLDRLMRERGLDSPYVLMEGPPSDYPKLRRHRNPKYRFEAVDGYRQPTL